AELAPAWPLNWNRVASPLAILKLFQLMTDRSLVWVMVSRLPPGVMLAAPLATTPPSGLAEVAVTKEKRMQVKDRPRAGRMIFFIVLSLLNLGTTARFV